MSVDFHPVETIIQDAYPSVPAAQLCIWKDGKSLYSRVFGMLDPKTGLRPADLTTRFDLASVTKLFTTTAFMTLVEAGEVGLDTPVREVVAEFTGMRPVAPYEAPLEEGAFVDVSGGAEGPVDAGKVTFRHLLTHTSGLPAWRPLYLLANETAARWTVFSSYFSYPTGARVVYSDLGLMLTGFALERLAGKRLDEVIAERIVAPLGLAHTGYLPVSEAASFGTGTNIAPAEICRWRKRRLVGEVDDENCGRLGGVAGHAGIFSTAEDLARFGQSFLDESPILKPAAIAGMTRLQAGEVKENPRGIGFDLRRDTPDDFTYPFSGTSFGHTGFTGTSLWIDPQRSLVAAFLTNEVYHGRYQRCIGQVRLAVHRAIAAAVDGDAHSG